MGISKQIDALCLAYKIYRTYVSLLMSVLIHHDTNPNVNINLFILQITVLVEEKTEEQGRGVAALRGGMAQLTPLFKPPHLKWLVLICIIQLGCMFG
jgi:hypothetical protein